MLRSTATASARATLRDAASLGGFLTGIWLLDARGRPEAEAQLDQLGLFAAVAGRDVI